MKEASAGEIKTTGPTGSEDDSITGLEYTEEEKHLFSLMTGFFKSKVLAVAMQLDFFTYLSRRPRKFEDIMDFLKFPMRPMRIFLDALVNMKLIVLNALDKYENTGLSRKYLVKSNLSYQKGTIELFDSLYKDCDHLLEALRQDCPPNKSYSYFFNKESDQVEDYSKQMDETSGNPVMALGQFFDFSDSEIVLDFGAGLGNTAMNLVSQFSHIEVILYDLPAVCEKAKEKLADYWLAHRIRIYPGDFFNGELPERFDTALMMRVTHDWSIGQVRLLFSKIYQRLPIGGKLIVYETIKDDNPRDPGDAAMVSILLLMISPAGECRSPGEIKAILREVGFTKIEVIHTIYIYYAIIATKETGGE